MASKATIGGKIVLEGEKEYNQALKNIKANQKELNTEMKLAAAQFKESQNSVDALEKKYDILGRQVKSQTEKVETYEKALKAAQDAQQKAADKIETLKNALEEASKKQKQMQESSDTAKEALEEQEKAVGELKEKLALAQSDYESISGKITRYKTSLNVAKAEQIDMSSELDKTKKYLQEAENSTDKCAKSIDEYGKETEEASEKTNILGDVLKANLASEVIINGVKELANGIKEIAESAVEVGTEFESSMSQVAATMGMTADEINSGSESYTKLSEAAKKCGKETKYSASEAGEALNYLALAGYDVKKSVETLPKVLDVAAAGNLDLAYASDLVTDSMAALNLETKDLDKYIDEMARTSQKSNTSVAQLGEATLVCAGTVTLTEQKLETMNAELGVLANNGLKGAEGGTHLRNILLSLSAPTDKAAIAIDQLGLKIADSQGNMRDLNDIMIDLNAAMSGMSSTEKTQLINTIFNKTDIAAVNALLKGTNGEYQDLVKELNNAEGAASKMAETMNNNLKGKVTILKSALEGLGISAYEVFDNDMKIAVEGATKAVGRLQDSIDKGDLGVSLNKMSKALGEFCERAVDTGEDALPVLIDGLTWLLDNSDAVIAGVTGIAAANIQMKVVGPAVEAVTLAWHSYKTANEGATVSQWLLNTAMDANPAGILITAIVGLTAAVGAYIIMNNDATESLSETVQKANELVESSKNINEELKKDSEERGKNREAFEIQMSSVKKLKDELIELSKKTTLTADEQERQKLIISELNHTLPDLNLAIDEQTGKLNMSTEAIDANIEALMEQAKAQAVQEDIYEIEEKRYEAKKNLYELEEQLSQLTQENSEIERQMADERALQNEAQLRYSEEVLAAYANNIEAQEAVKQQISSTTETVEGLESEYLFLNEYLADTSSIDAAAGAAEALGDAAAGAGNKVTGFSEQVQTAMADMQEDLLETLDSQMQLFEKFDNRSTISKETLLENMQSQVDGVREWAENIQKLAEENIDKGLLQTLADMGPDGAEYVNAFVDMTTDELEKANEMYREALTVKGNAASDVTEAWGGLAQDSIDGYVAGIEENKEKVSNVTEEVGKDAVDGVARGQESHSPSKKFEEQGKNAIEGYKLGITRNKVALLLVINNLANEIIRTSQNGLSTSKFHEIGKQIPAGLVSGINSGRSEVVNAVQRMCDEAVQRAKDALEIHSPSAKFDYLGKMSGEGYIQGLISQMEQVNGVIESIIPKEISLVNTNTGIPERPSQMINQNVYVYAKQNSIIEQSREFKRAMQEAAEEW